MRFRIDRETLLTPLQSVQGVVERRQTLPILSNLLLHIADDQLSVTATDMEVELIAQVAISGADSGEVTVPARKFMDICRSLPQAAQVDFSAVDGKATIRSGHSRFTLSTLPAGDYPVSDPLSDAFTFDVGEAALKQLIDLTQFAMAHQDVRYYLNGLLLEVGEEYLRTVATDGHRLALAEAGVSGLEVPEARQVILPRKSVAELGRLLGNGDRAVSIAVAGNAVRIGVGSLRMWSKLIDGRFPDYSRVIPLSEQCDKRVVVERDLLRQALQRASILSNEKYRTVRLSLKPGLLRVVANNPEQEEAEDEVPLEYSGDPLEIGFNVSYLLDALSALPSDSAELYLSDPDSSCLIQAEGRKDCKYVVMPMRL